MDSKGIPQLVAHRGYMEKYPENSWMGLKAAMDTGACWIEFDVQMCSDGEFILLHDASLKRTASIEKTIFETSLKDLNTVSLHEQDRFGHKFYPLPVTTLDTALRKLSHYPQVTVMIEIKEESLKHWGVPKVMESLLNRLGAHKGKCVLISFSHEALLYARNHSDMDIGWVLHEYDDTRKQRALALEPEYLICNQDKLPRNKAPWSGPWKWMLYDITSPKEALNWGDLGVDLIETGDIGGMLRNTRLVDKACYHGV
jgi:glycerophosphoryl diester phosphodiesterase